MSVKVFYILGLGHSGTTLLSRMLGTHAQIVATGGSKNVPLFVRGEKDCSCGATHPGDCDFWTRVDDALAGRGTALSQLQFRYGNARPDPDSLRNFYSAVSETAGASAVIDTSRRVSYLKALQSVAGIEFIPVHIFKDPRAQCASAKRKGDSVWSGIWNYNLRSWRIRSLYPLNPNMIHIPYEALCADPESQIQRILDCIGLTFEPRQVTDFSQTESHVLGGNRQFRKKSVDIRLDESWRQRLTPLEKWVSLLFCRRTWEANMRASGATDYALDSDPRTTK